MIVSKIDMHVSRILQVSSARPRCLAQSLSNVNFFLNSEMLAGVFGAKNGEEAFILKEKIPFADFTGI